MSRSNRLIRKKASRSGSDVDRTQWIDFYQNSEKFIESQLQQALTADLEAALHLVESIHQDHWAW